jgi:hypothetical protein
MGTSHPESRPWSVKKIMSVSPTNILDVGAGSGTYAEALRAAGYYQNIDAVEIWGPYISEFKLLKKYRKVWQEDIRNFDKFNYDVVIFGDILEHMPKEEAVMVWEKTAEQAKYALISIPIIDVHQDELNGNPYEKHYKDDWTPEEVVDTFSHIKDQWCGNIVGAFWAEFN